MLAELRPALFQDRRAIRGATTTPRVRRHHDAQRSRRPGFIADVIQNLTAGRRRAGGDSFDAALSQDEDASALEFLQQDSSGNFVFNFAAGTCAAARQHRPARWRKSVRVFFRLFQAQSTSSNFDTATTYRLSSDGQLNGVTVPLLGVQNNASNP